MRYFFAAFGSRAQGMRLFDTLKRCGLTVALINTPREASLGCGLSVKFHECSFDAVNDILLSGCYTAFMGFFEYNCGKVYRIN